MSKFHLYGYCPQPTTPKLNQVIVYRNLMFTLVIPTPITLRKLPLMCYQTLSSSIILSHDLSASLICGTIEDTNNDG
jgi:hypothetical protein